MIYVVGYTLKEAGISERPNNLIKIVRLVVKSIKFNLAPDVRME